MVVYLNLPEESDETFAFLKEMRSIVGKYYDSDYYVVGNSTSSRDLSSSFAKDNLVISILSSLFVILVLLFTFQSAGLPILLIACILGSVWINFSVPTLANQPLYFLGYLIVQSIQMGANIDYAIVIGTRFSELKDKMDHEQAMIETINFAFPTILTSGTIMAVSGTLIGQMTSDACIVGIGSALAEAPSSPSSSSSSSCPRSCWLALRSSIRRASPCPSWWHAAAAMARMRVNGIVQGEIHGSVARYDERHRGR